MLASGSKKAHEGFILIGVALLGFVASTGILVCCYGPGCRELELREWNAGSLIGKDKGCSRTRLHGYLFSRRVTPSFWYCDAAVPSALADAYLTEFSSSAVHRRSCGHLREPMPQVHRHHLSISTRNSMVRSIALFVEMVIW